MRSAAPPPPCLAFVRAGRCRFGARCRFAHDAIAVAAAYVPPASSSPSACPDAQQQAARPLRRRRGLRGVDVAAATLAPGEYVGRALFLVDLDNVAPQLLECVIGKGLPVVGFGRCGFPLNAVPPGVRLCSASRPGREAADHLISFYCGHFVEKWRRAGNVSVCIVSSDAALGNVCNMLNQCGVSAVVFGAGEAEALQRFVKRAVASQRRVPSSIDEVLRDEPWMLASVATAAVAVKGGAAMTTAGEAASAVATSGSKLASRTVLDSLHAVDEAHQRAARALDAEEELDARFSSRASELGATLERMAHDLRRLLDTL